MTKEQNYSQLEGESLSIIFGISKFHDHLWGHHFVIETDHQPLVKILGECAGIPTIASSRLQRWALKLAAHTYTISFRKGVSHANADLLSCLPAEHTEAAGPSEGTKVVQKLCINSLPVTAAEVARATRADTQLSQVLAYSWNDWPEVMSQPLRPYFLKRDSITIEQDVFTVRCQSNCS